MPDIFFPSRPTPVEELFASDDKEAINAFLKDNMRTGACSTLAANSPYCLGRVRPEDKAILNAIEAIPRQNREQLMCMVDVFGDTTRTIAAFYDRHLADLDLRSLSDAGATATTARLTGVQKALVDYQSALDNLHKHRGVGRGASARLMELRRAVKQKYEVLQQKYQTELKQLARHPGKNRGNAINSVQRGITLAERRAGRNLYVANAAEAKQLNRLARNIRFAGNSLIMLDAVSRVRNVYDTHHSGGNWQREASIEATAFGLAGAAGIATGKAVIAGLTFIGLGLTPVGWVVLIGVGVAAGAAAAMQADKYGKQLATDLWNRH